MAQVIISVNLQLRQIVVAAGGDPALSFYQRGTLDVPDVTQGALDAAVAAYNDPAAEAITKEAQLNAALQAPVDAAWNATLFDQENRVRALEGLAPLTVRQFFDLLLTRFPS